MIESMDNKNNVSVKISDDLHVRARRKMLSPKVGWADLIAKLLEDWVASDDSAPIKVPVDPLDAKARQLRDWLAYLEAAPQDHPEKPTLMFIQTKLKRGIQEMQAGEHLEVKDKGKSISDRLRRGKPLDAE